MKLVSKRFALDVSLNLVVAARMDDSNQWKERTLHVSTQTCSSVADPFFLKLPDIE